MATLPLQVQQSINYIADLVQVNPEWLVFPGIITIFLIPLVLNIVMLKIFFQKVLRMFPDGGVIDWILAGLIGYLILPFNQVTVFIAPIIIGFLGVESKLKKILTIIILYAVIFLIPYISSLLAQYVRI